MMDFVGLFLRSVYAYILYSLYNGSVISIIFVLGIAYILVESYK